jgi:V8-like Glu-specific endopeptidase
VPIGRKIMTRAFPRRTIIASIAVTISLMGSGIIATTAKAEGTSLTPTVTVDGAVATLTAPSSAIALKAAEDYWTPKRMREAEPLPSPELPSGPDSTKKQSLPQEPRPEKAGTALQPVSPPASATASTSTSMPPITSGRLLFTTGNGGQASCSASVINSEHRNLIETAGHCLYYAKYGGWARNFMFVPAYYSGAAPYGRWYYSGAVTFASWVTSEDYNHDFAFLTMRPVAGRQLADAVGANALTYGRSTAMSDVLIVGWSAEGSYDGHEAQLCYGSTVRYRNRQSDNNAEMSNCPNIVGGASGGPWLIDRVNYHAGYVFTVSSRADRSTGKSYAVPHTKDIMIIYNTVR